MAWKPSTNPSTIQKWRARVVDFTSSRLSVAAFCQSTGISPSSLRKWCRWVEQNPPQLPALVEVRVTDAAPVPDVATMVVELDRGRRLVLEPGFDDRAVGRLIGLLERL